MANWVVSAKRADFQAMGKKYGIDPVIARIIRNRDIERDEDIQLFLNGTLEQMHDPLGLQDMDKAVEFLVTEIRKESKIRIIGDYDIDGICASYILRKGLMACGADSSVAIPHRVTDGYGLNRNLIQAAYEDGVQVIITCDNGISASEEIAYAKELGMQVVVTDHHCVPYEEDGDGRREILPDCVAIINPKREADTYPFPELCGAMVACKLMEAMYHFLELDWNEVRGEYLEIGAFATIGDLMPLRGENRILVKHGLEHMRHTANIGLRSLMEVNGIMPEQLSAYHIGFVLGPCFNATGRLETAMKTIALLESNHQEQAQALALELKELNDTRKELTLQGVEEAKVVLEGSKNQNDRVLVVYLEQCHESLAGIIAGRIKEQYYKPTFILTKGEEGVKGSGRSIEAYSMFEEMVQQEHFFTKYGGHAMAAGLSMRAEVVDDFRIAMNESCTLTEEDLQEKVIIDVPMPLDYITESLIEELKRLEPFGMGNHKPIFATKDILVLSHRIIGKKQNVWKAKVESEGGIPFDVVYFGDVQGIDQYLQQEGRIRTNRGTKLSITYYPSMNEYQGVRSIQIVITGYQ